nr:uncharacterized mitochondrial protein AtMg00810-like [Tanacetum cinerariifolium]
MIDYDEVFALVARIKEIRLFLAYASFKDFVVYQMDVKSAFLYGKIEKEELCNAFKRLMHEKFQMSYMETQKPLLKDEDGEEVDVHMYRSMIGSLMYLTSSRPDLMFAVCACARYQVSPKVSHIYDVKRIFRYLKGQPKLGLWYPKDSPFDLVVYTDSDYVGASLDKTSTTKGCQFLRCRLISWQCKNKTVVANSTTEAEYMDASSCYRQVLWILNQLLDYGITNLFPSMLVQNPMVEGSAIPTDPQHTPTILQPSSSQPKKTQKPRKPKRKVTEVPQPSKPMKLVAYKVVYKELDDRLVRAATTASSLEAKQDSGGGPRCQEAMRDTIAQTRFENVSKLFNDSLLTRGNTRIRYEDRMKLNELMELCTNLHSRVFDLEKIKTTQALEITSLKKRVKKQEKKQRSRAHKLKRLYKERKSNDIDADEDITLVNDQDDTEMFDLNDLHGEEVFVEKEVVDKEVNDEVQKVVEEVVEDINTAKLIVDATLVSDAEKRRKHFAAKAAEEKKNKPPTQAQQRKIMCTYLKNVEGKKLKDLKNKSFDYIQKMFDRAFNRVNTFVDFRTELVEEHKELMKIIHDEKEVAIDVIPLVVKSQKIVDWKIHKEGKKSYYQTIRADGKSKMYMVFNQMLKEFDREYMEYLYNLVKAKYRSTRLVEDLDLLLWGDLKTMIEPYIEDQVWKTQHGYKVLE